MGQILHCASMTWPNIAVEPTPYSVRSCVAHAFRRGPLLVFGCSPHLMALLLLKGGNYGSRITHAFHRVFAHRVVYYGACRCHYRLERQDRGRGSTGTPIPSCPYP